MTTTIFALSSGPAPAAIAVIRISGPMAREALVRLGARLPEERRATRRVLRDAAGTTLDDALVLWLPGPGTATGDDMVELHCHGGRAVIAAVETALAAIPALRRAAPGEFTRRAFVNGRIDLAEAEGLADLLSAETELQRLSALAMAGGGLSRSVETWRMALLEASAMIEAVLDFSDDEDAAELPPAFAERLSILKRELAASLERPAAERLRDGFRVVLAGPPNAGKSSLFNALVEHEAAITAPIAGTTRDVLSAPVALCGIPFVFEDTAGLHDGHAEAIEAIGMGRARAAIDRADLVLWMGPEGNGPVGAWEIEPQIDRCGPHPKQSPRHRVSAVTGAGLDALRSALIAAARAAMPRPGEAALNKRQRGLLAIACDEVSGAIRATDPLLIAEHLRLARTEFDTLVGRTATEDMLDALFGRFCIGK